MISPRRASRNSCSHGTMISCLRGRNGDRRGLTSRFPGRGSEIYPVGAYCKYPAGVYAGGCSSGAGSMKRDDKPKLINRLNRIEGQVRGISRMVDDERYCIDILTQLQAARAALVRVETELLKGHLSHCIESAIVGGDAGEQRQKAGELIELLQRAT